MIVSMESDRRYLIARSRYKVWMPPQEGINIGESISSAVSRCLEAECGLRIPKNHVSSIERTLNIRSSVYVGSAKLSKKRKGERPVADNASESLLGYKKMTGKAYWLTTVLVENIASYEFKPDNIELEALRWVSLEKAREMIRSTNTKEKIKILEKCLSLTEHDLSLKR